MDGWMVVCVVTFIRQGFSFEHCGKIALRLNPWTSHDVLFCGNKPACRHAQHTCLCVSGTRECY